MSELSQPPTDLKLAQGISYFEEVLQLMPNDRPALEYLAVAYEQLGDQRKRSRMVARLTDVLIAEKDIECLKNIRSTLQEINTSETQEALKKIASFLSSSAQATPEEARPDVFKSELLAAIKAEMELLNTLQAKQAISEGTAKIVESALYNYLSQQDSILISALCFVKNENPAEAETAIAALADAFHLPPVPLTAALAGGKAPPPLPEAISRRGVRPFAEVGDTLLVAILNPQDEKLRKEISNAAGKPCEFFLADPSEMEAALS